MLEFRPVNTLKIYEQKLELILKELITHCIDNSILIAKKSDSRMNLSCESALQFIISDRIKTISKNHYHSCSVLRFSTCIWNNESTVTNSQSYQNGYWWDYWDCT
ncbi:hypothetical protein NQ314_010681 [Rhamnusium bicolor]|uniref:Uncharacterized protein n=1 Tax=Rhamnusium bicolor TaxID=1586634 RepID=A0AAV8XQI8_9CUCU|nr:hypothetical protein NQ314_010681 [Rhamnusium bicolor]